MNKYLKILVEDMHSAIVATVDADGRPQTRAIDMMLWDAEGVYFLTAKGKELYRQLMEQGYLALSAVKDKRSISLRGKIRNIGKRKLDEIFEKNVYMQSIYPGETRDALDVFQLYEAEGEFFDISEPAHVVRDSIIIGNSKVGQGGYVIGNGCIGCGLCLDACPQRCITTDRVPAVIDPHRCLHCGRCVEVCPQQAIIPWIPFGK